MNSYVDVNSIEQHITVVNCYMLFYFKKFLFFYYCAQDPFPENPCDLPAAVEEAMMKAVFPWGNAD